MCFFGLELVFLLLLYVEMVVDCLDGLGNMMVKLVLKNIGVYDVFMWLV